MIQAQFRIGGEVVSVIIDSNNLMFMDDAGTTTTIEGLKLSRAGAIKEFPELELKEDWRKAIIEKFKQKIKGYNSEMDKLNYIKEELEKFGYEPQYYQKAGHRPNRFL